jgi:hypothetical protein
MNRFLIAMGLLLLVVDGSAIAQSGTSSGSSASKSRPATTSEAPVGHRQPKVGDLPDEKNLRSPSDQANKEDAELDRKIKNICRGC